MPTNTTATEIEDYETTRARKRSKYGLSRELSRERTQHNENPAVGGARGYPMWYRHYAIERVTNDGFDVINEIPGSRASVYRWLDRMNPYQMTGNHERANLVGGDMLLMALAYYIWPDAHLNEVAAFIYNNGGGLYYDQEIQRRKQELGLTRKRSSVESFDAYSFENRMRCELFFSRPPPLGVVGLAIERLIDCDEASFALHKCDRKYGSAHSSMRVRVVGNHYQMNKVLVLLAFEPGDPTLPDNVDGSLANPRRWFEVHHTSGTTAFMFRNFVNNICTDLEENPVPGDLDAERYILYDNLSAHLSPYVAQTLELRESPNRFMGIARPPYQPKYGPTEYVFCYLAAQLQKLCRPGWTLDDLSEAIIQILSQFGREGVSDRIFRHALVGEAY